MKIKDIISYLQGNIRYFCYHKKYLNWMISKHIKEQYVYRINSMDKECYDNGSCKECGCKTTHLQFANKACEGHCYPVMENKSWWNITKKYSIVFCKDDINFKILEDKQKFERT